MTVFLTKVGNELASDNSLQLGWALVCNPSPGDYIELL